MIRVSTRAEDAPGKPFQSHISLSILSYTKIIADNRKHGQAAVVSMGICYSICASALWPCVAIVIPKPETSNNPKP